MRGNRYHGAGITLVCIDSYDDSVMTGRLHHSRLGEAGSFRSLVGFLAQMERLMDIENVPQSFTTVRTFTPSLGLMHDMPVSAAPRSGRLATFEVHILFRQNASWQGSLHWLEKNQEQHFRSVLELISLIDSALSGTREELRSEYPA